MIPEFPDRMRRYAIGYFGAGGVAWLEVLPDILTRCCEKWGLTLGPVVKEIKANYVGYAGALFEYVLWALRWLKDEPDEDEQVKLGIYLEIGEGIDLLTL